MNVEVFQDFSKLYVMTDDIEMMKKRINDAWLITCDYPGVKITTCSDGWTCIDGMLSAADAAAIEARLDAVFS